MVTTPLNVAAWQACLKSHPDADFVMYILQELQHGFCIGVDCNRLRPAKANMLSASQNPSIIHDYLTKECTSHHILGPYHPQSFPGIHINQFGVTLKKHQQGKWHLITDLSYPKGYSVNYAVDPAHCSLLYTSVDRVSMEQCD